MMGKTKLLFAICLTLLAGQVVAGDVAPAPNGIEFPKGYQDWRVISMSHRVDNKTVRIIYGNDKAIEASRAGQTNPWPDGAALGKVVWKQEEKENWPTAIAPNKFVHAEFMFKDAKKYAKTAGWGWARWVGMEQKPFTKGEQVCISCHTPVKNNDWVFTKPAVLPPVIK